MKILYITPHKIIPTIYHPSDDAMDMGIVKEIIVNGIKSKFENIEVVFAKEIVNENKFISVDDLSKYDLYISDLTGGFPHITYASGVVEGLGKPIIYFSSSDSATPTGFGHKNILIYSKASLENEFRIELNNIIKSAKNDPNGFISKSDGKSNMPKAFISYSHNDKAYLDRLMVHLKPLIKRGAVDVWVDTRIKTGDKWKERIMTALTDSHIAILLISADFLASDFVVDNELPPILSEAEVKGTKILPVIVSPCRFAREDELCRFQAINSPSDPLSLQSDENRELVYDNLAQELEAALKNS